MSRRLVLAPVLVAGVLAGCSDDEPAVVVAYPSERVAPVRADLPPGGDESPHPEDALKAVDLEGGGRMVVWIDPRDMRVVRAQASDPDDPTRWTEPVVVLRAGDGCLYLELDAAGGTVGLGASCYERDVFAQQAPDQSFAAVTTDLVGWELLEMNSEADPDPHVDDDGERVVWTNGALGDYEVAEWDGSF